MSMSKDQQRAENIRRNRETFVQLGLVETHVSNARVHQQKKSHSSVKQEREKTRTQPSRKLRIAKLYFGGGTTRHSSMTSVTVKYHDISAADVPKKPEGCDDELNCFCNASEDESVDQNQIQCDACGRWCHACCTGIAESTLSSIEFMMCPDCTEEEDSGVDCFCNTKCHKASADMNFDGGWILCDGCEKWCHSQCAGFTSKEAEAVDSYNCPRCELEEQKHPMKRARIFDGKGRPSSTTRPNCEQCGASNDYVVTLGGGTYPKYRYNCNKCNHKWQQEPIYIEEQQTLEN